MGKPADTPPDHTTTPPDHATPHDRELLGFVRRCSTPTQMVNGRADGYAESQAPLFRNLGTPADHKRHVVFASDHSLSGFQKDVVKVNLEWFDRYLGPVR